MAYSNARNIDEYVKTYKLNSFEQTMTRYRKKNILKFLDLYKPKKILEIGCGLDSISNHYTSFNEFTVVEPSHEFCEILKSNQTKKNIKVINKLFEDTVDRIKNYDYDFIICSALLHEVTDPHKLLKCIASVAHEETVIRIDVQNNRSFHLLWAVCAGIIDELGQLTSTAISYQQHSSYNIELLTQDIEKAGMTIVESGSYFIKPFNHTKMQKLVEQNIIDDSLLEGLDRLIDFMPEFGSEIYIHAKVLK